MVAVVVVVFIVEKKVKERRERGWKRSQLWPVCDINTYFLYMKKLKRHEHDIYAIRSLSCCAGLR